MVQSYFILNYDIDIELKILEAQIDMSSYIIQTILL